MGVHSFRRESPRYTRVPRVKSNAATVRSMTCSAVLTRQVSALCFSQRPRSDMTPTRTQRERHPTDVEIAGSRWALSLSSPRGDSKISRAQYVLRIRHGHTVHRASVWSVAGPLCSDWSRKHHVCGLQLRTPCRPSVSSQRQAPASHGSCVEYGES